LKLKKLLNSEKTWYLYIVYFAIAVIAHQLILYYDILWEKTGWDELSNQTTLIIEIAIGVIITITVTAYSRNSQKKVNEILIDLKQEKQKRKYFALSRLRIDVNQIIHYLQKMEEMLDDSEKNYSDAQILSCLSNSKAQIRDIEDILKISSSDVNPSLSNTLRKRCDFLQIYHDTYQLRKTIGPKQVGLLNTFEKSFMEISDNFHDA